MFYNEKEKVEFFFLLKKWTQFISLKVPCLASEFYLPKWNFSLTFQIFNAYNLFYKQIQILNINDTVRNVVASELVVK
jgi:hypothetical protein